MNIWMWLSLGWFVLAVSLCLSAEKKGYRIFWAVLFVVHAVIFAAEWSGLT